MIHWLLGPAKAPGALSVRTERFDGLDVDVSRGLELLRATPERVRYQVAIGDLIPGLPVAARADLIDRLLVRFALYVLDLPASESHHDAGPGGHLDHALCVSHAVVEALAASNLSLSQDPVRQHEERPPWVYAGFVAALLHDAGKLFDVEIQSPDQREIWNPLVEPLAHFFDRQRIVSSKDARLRFLPGRGMKAHKWRGLYFQRILPTREILSRLGLRLAHITEAYLEPPLGELPPNIPLAAREVANLIRKHDANLAKLVPSKASQATPTVESVAPPLPTPIFTPANASAAVGPAQATLLRLGVDEHKVSEQGRGSDVIVAVPVLCADRRSKPLSQPGTRPLPVDGEQGRPHWGIGIGSQPKTESSTREDRLVLGFKRQLSIGGLSKNGFESDVYIASDFTWAIYPTALRSFAKRDGLAGDPASHDQKLLAALRASGLLVRWEGKGDLVRIRTHPGAGAPKMALSFRTNQVLNSEARKDVTFWPGPVEILESQSGGDGREGTEAA